MEELHKRVIKRSGEEVDFDLHKIVNAINAANEETDKLHQICLLYTSPSPRD